MKRQSELTNVLHMGIASLWFLVTLLVEVGLSFNPAEAQPFLYVTNSLSATVSVIDTNPSSPHYNKVVSTITGPGVVKVPGPPHTLNSMSSPFFIAITPDGTRAYVTIAASDTISVIDTDPASTDFNKVVSTIEVGRASIFVAITPDGTRAYLTNRWDGTVSVIDTDPNSPDFNKVVSIIDAGREPFGINITPDGTRAYVTFFYCTYTLTRECRSGVQVIDTETDTVIDTIEDLGMFAYIIAFTPDGTRAYLAPYKSPVKVIDTSDNSVVDTIKMDRGPFGPYGPYWAAIAPSVDTDSYSAAFEKRRRKTPWQ